MNNQVLSIFFAFIGSSMINIGQAIQKIGMDTPAEKLKKKWGIWAGGTCFTMAGPFVILYATSLGGATIVGAMSGTGLAVLALFSHFVMKEKIKINELAGVAIILAASVIIGVFSTGGNTASIINLQTLYVFIGIITLLYVIFTIISLLANKLEGLVLGGFAGATGGIVVLFQKVTTSNPTGASSLFTNPFFYTWIIVSLVSFLIMQFSYKKDKAIRIVPSFSANFILIPVLGGIICYSEVLSVLQWIGVALIFCGVLAITIRVDISRGKE
jgi:drug/metabolite transporter (DMT)-like permease